MKLFEMKKDYKIYVDLDGVMADLDKHVKERTGMTFLQLRASGSGFTDFCANFTFTTYAKTSISKSYSIVVIFHVYPFLV